ncbi:BON domain-containing protein [Tundrisphaera sp. TA3]|uniref:BON domain-containing protein n=1 Tax=Tundrisphaera sp. TA3 TaxID=3435775 RepID=UPI003EBA8A02
MRRMIIRRTVPAVAVATLAFAWAGHAQEPGVGQKAGEKLDATIQDIKGGLNKAGSAIKDRFAQAKTSASNLGVEARIYSRLQWDKSLADSLIELTSEEAGVFILSGQVADEAARQRAVNLAETTVGVTRVDDRLSIRPAGTPSPAPAKSKNRAAKPARP